MTSESGAPTTGSVNVLCLRPFSGINLGMSTKRNYQPKKRKRRNTHGFLKRTATRTGRATILRSRRKGRAKLSA